MRYVMFLNLAACVGLWVLTSSEWFAVPILLGLGGLAIMSKDR
jgi:hypothetical protein